MQSDEQLDWQPLELDEQFDLQSLELGEQFDLQSWLDGEQLCEHEFELGDGEQLWLQPLLLLVLLPELEPPQCCEPQPLLPELL